MTYTPGALRSRAQSYFRDAQTFADMPPDDLAAGGMTHAQWAAVYVTVSNELHKIADEAEAARR